MWEEVVLQHIHCELELALSTRLLVYSQWGVHCLGRDVLQSRLLVRVDVSVHNGGAESSKQALHLLDVLVHIEHDHGTNLLISRHSKRTEQGEQRNWGLHPWDLNEHPVTEAVILGGDIHGDLLGRDALEVWNRLYLGCPRPAIVVLLHVEALDQVLSSTLLRQTSLLRAVDDEVSTRIHLALPSNAGGHVFVLLNHTYA